MVADAETDVFWGATLCEEFEIHRPVEGSGVWVLTTSLHFRYLKPVGGSSSAQTCVIFLSPIKSLFSTHLDI